MGIEGGDDRRVEEAADDQGEAAVEIEGGDEVGDDRPAKEAAGDDQNKQAAAAKGMFNWHYCCFTEKNFHD